MQSRSTTSSRHTRRRVATLLGGGALLLAVVGGTAAAKEIGSGTGGGTTTPTCNPVSSLSVKTDPRVGETGLATLSASYSVKPCISGQEVTVAVSTYEYLDNTAVVYDDPAAPLNGKFVTAIRVRVTYVTKVDVYDAVTGQLAGSLSAAAAAIPKGV